MNDIPDVPFTAPERLGYERLLRNLARLPGRPALVQLHSSRWYRYVEETGELQRGVFYETHVEAQFTVFAHVRQRGRVALLTAGWGERSVAQAGGGAAGGRVCWIIEYSRALLNLLLLHACAAVLQHGVGVAAGCRLPAVPRRGQGLQGKPAAPASCRLE